jgi:hypothetical protein
MIGGRTALAVTLVRVAACVADTPSASRKVHDPLRICGLTGDSPEDLLRQVRAMPGAKRVGESDRFFAYAVGSGTVTWTFTKPADPAHPAVACRTIAQKPDGSLTASTHLVCGASKRACDRLRGEFAELDEQLKAAIAEDLRARSQ